MKTQDKFELNTQSLFAFSQEGQDYLLDTGTCPETFTMPTWTINVSAACPNPKRR